MAEGDLTRLEAERDRLAGQLRRPARGADSGTAGLKMSIRDNAGHLVAAVARRDGAAGRLTQLAPQLTASIEASLRAALPQTTGSIADLDRRLAESLDALGQATETWESCAEQTRELAAKTEWLRLQPPPGYDDEEIVSRARAGDLQRKFAELPDRKRQVADILGEIARLEDRHEHVLSRMRRESSQIRKEIVRDARVVATTLAKLRMTQELRERDYDFVIVDEVSAACPPEVLYAVSRATKGVTLLGDFLQNGPIIPDALQDSSEDAVRRWYGQDCFAFFGIRDASSARDNLGCVMLTQQYRFGPVINDLANAVAYRGVLQAARSGAAEPEGGEVVLVDVDGLGDELAGIRRDKPSAQAGWWPIGVLLARALAERRVRQAEEAGEGASMKAGILVPYRIQQQLTQDVLTESGASPQIEVGTSHRFQGREFDTVIFDLVEDGKGWIAQGDLNGSRYQASGLRLFNVGITRAQRRLYLIANAAAMRKARTGPLREVRRMLDAGLIQVVRATEILELTDAPVGDPVVGEIWHALRDHATLIDLFDEDHLPDELRRRIDAAQERIWLWSPWVGRRSEQLLPQLRAAQDRGVRVHPVVLPRDQINMHLKSRHEELAAQLKHTIYLGKEHQKLVIIDRDLTFIGSMNVLAHAPGSRHEVMALFQSATLVDQLLRHERADQLRQPPTCARCGASVKHVRVFSDHHERRLYWLCVADECGWRQPLPDQEGTRNQPRRRR